MQARQRFRASAADAGLVLGLHTTSPLQNQPMNRTSRGLKIQFMAGASRRLNSQSWVGAQRPMTWQAIVAVKSKAHHCLCDFLPVPAHNPKMQTRQLCSGSGLALPVKCSTVQHRAPAAALPNPSLNRTRYGRQRKPGAQRLRHCRAPGLRCLPPRAG